MTSPRTLEPVRRELLSGLLFTSSRLERGLGLARLHELVSTTPSGEERSKASNLSRRREK